MKTIKLKNGTANLHFGWAALRDWTNITKRSLNDLQKIGDEMTVDETITLIWSGLKQGARKLKAQFELTPDDVADMMDDNPDLITIAMEEFSASMATGVDAPNAKGGAKPPKKKQSR